MSVIDFLIKIMDFKYDFGIHKTKYMYSVQLIPLQLNQTKNQTKLN